MTYLSTPDVLQTNDLLLKPLKITTQTLHRLHWPKSKWGEAYGHLQNSIFADSPKHTVIMGVPLCPLGRFLVSLGLFYSALRFIGFVFLEKKRGGGDPLKGGKPTIKVTVPTYFVEDVTAGGVVHLLHAHPTLVLLVVTLAGFSLLMMLLLLFYSKSEEKVPRLKKKKKKKSGGRRRSEKRTAGGSSRAF